MDMCACWVTQSCLTLCDPMDCSPPGTSVHGGSPGKNTGVGCHFLLQRIFPTQGLNLGLLHCRQMLYHLSHQGSQRTEVTSEKTECLYNARYLSKFGLALNLIYLANDQQENRDLSPTATQNWIPLTIEAHSPPESPNRRPNWMTSWFLPLKLEAE